MELVLEFYGGIRYKNYIATFAKGTVNIEDQSHPVMKGVSPPFLVQKEEWYTYDQDPRPNVHVLASVDESTYEPKDGITMGDHPVVWINPEKKPVTFTSLWDTRLCFLIVRIIPGFSAMLYSGPPENKYEVAGIE
ncbi:ThuA domain-containing protein [Mucilaginibacter sp. P25]|uniref:ThuA domain-containing protein n=1 Tax=unclassified Mucilaginibacter TaxID=2617802 RepID=UPI003D6758D8